MSEEKITETCRMYREEIPQLGDLVSLKITEITDTIVKGQLTEYNNLPADIPFTFIKNGRIRNINRYVKVGQIKICEVIEFDINNYVYVSMKNVDRGLLKEFIENFKKANAVHEIVKFLSKKMNIAQYDLYDQYFWDIEDLYALFIECHKNQSIDLPIDLPNDIKNTLLITLNKKIINKKKTYHGQISITNNSINGVEIIKKALLSVKARKDIKITLVRSPIWDISITTKNKKTLQKIFDDICNTINEHDIDMKVIKNILT